MKTLHTLIYWVVPVLLVACGNQATQENVEDTKDTTVQVTETDTEEKTESSEAEKSETTEEPQSAESISESLQGIWQSQDDPKSKIEFRVDLRVDIYDEKEIDKAQFSIENTCPSTPDLKSEKPEYIVSDDMCWFIETLNDTELVLNYTARGNTLKYKKVQ